MPHESTDAQSAVGEGQSLSIAHAAAHEWTAAQIAIVRHLLLEGWPTLSRGDRSVVTAMMAKEDAVAATMSGSPHSLFWESLIILGCAEQANDALHPSLPADTRMYRFHPSGRDWFAGFYEHYDLEKVSIRSERQAR